MKLAESEFRAIRFMAFGGSYKSSADVLGITRQTLNTYLNRAYRKLKVHRWQDAMIKIRNHTPN